MESPCLAAYDQRQYHNLRSLASASFDHEDMAFIGVHNSRRDFGTVSLSVRVPDGTLLDINCHFYAFGWYRGDLDNAQFSVVESDLYFEQNTANQPWVESWDRSANDLIHRLSSQGVPKQSSVAVGLGISGKSAMVEFSILPQDPTNVCSHMYWKVNFTCRIYTAEECPEITTENWDLYPGL